MQTTRGCNSGMAAWLGKITPCLAGLVALVASSGSQATSIGLVQTEPDISGQINVAYVYDAGTPDECLHNNGNSQGPCGTGAYNGPVVPGSGTPGSGTLNIDDLNTVLFYHDGATTGFFGDLSIVANFDASGSFIDGTLSISISGGGPIPGISGPAIVTGDLFNFGFAGSGSGGVLEFESSISGGDWSTLYGLGATTGTIAGVTLASGAPGSGVDWDLDATLFTRSWSGSGSQDTFVPVPAAVWLFGSGLIALVGMARRRRQV